MPVWLEEFLIVTDASRRLQLALLAVAIVPSVIVLFGAFYVGHIRETAGPLMHLVASVSESLFYAFLSIAISAGIGCIKVAAREYRRTRKRLFA